MRCRLLIPDAGPVNSLWVADSLELLLKVGMDIIIIDAVFDEMTSDPSYRKDREVKAFIKDNRPPFFIVETDMGRLERARRERGEAPKTNAGEVAIADFMTSETGLDTWISAGEPVVILSEDMRAMRRLFLSEPNVHALGTIGFLRGMEKAGLLASADMVLDRMLRPVAPGRRPEDARVLAKDVDSLDRPAIEGSSWIPNLRSG